MYLFDVMRFAAIFALLTSAAVAAESATPQPSAPVPPRRPAAAVVAVPGAPQATAPMPPLGKAPIPPNSEVSPVPVPPAATNGSTPPPPSPNPQNAPGASAPPGVAPQKWPESRYDDLRDHSPFALATAAAPPPPPEHNFAEGLKIKGLGYAPDKDGILKRTVFVQSAQSAANKLSFVLDGEDPGTGDGAGISVSKINESPEWGKTTVELKKGNEFATIEYDQMEVQAAPTPQAPVRANNVGFRNPVQQNPRAVPRPIPNASPGPQIRSGVGYPQGTAPPGQPPPRRPVTRVVTQ